MTGSTYMTKVYDLKTRSFGNRSASGRKHVIRIILASKQPSSCGKTLDNNDLNQVVVSSGFSENKGLGGVLSLAGS